MEHKGVEITVDDKGIFWAKVGTRTRYFYSAYAAKSAIDWSQKTIFQKTRPTIFWVLIAAAMFGFFAYQDHMERKAMEQREASIQRGVLMDASCSIQEHREAEKKLRERAVVDLGINEEACIGYVMVDKDRRLYLRNDTTIATPATPATDCVHTVMRKADGYYLRCGTRPLNDPLEIALADISWAIPVKNFY